MFKINNPQGAVLEHKINKEIAGVVARKEMLDNIRINEFKISGKRIVRGDVIYDNKYVDAKDAQKHLRDFQRNYDRTSPEELSNIEKNHLWKRAKQLKDEFIIGMLSRDELHPIKTINYDGAIQNIVDNEKLINTRSAERNTIWYKRNAEKIMEYKNIMRQLSPRDENMSLEEQLLAEKNFTDIEKFRPRNSGNG